MCDFNGYYDAADPSVSTDFGNLFYCWTDCHNISQILLNKHVFNADTGTKRLELMITNFLGFLVN